MFHPLRDPQLQFKSEKYKLNKNMEDIIKYNLKKIQCFTNKNLFKLLLYNFYMLSMKISIWHKNSEI